VNRLVWWSAALAACAPDLSGDLDSGPPLATGAYVVDATSETEAVGYDLDTAAVVDLSDPAWDLSFLRYFVRLNGGVSGPGTVEAVPVPGVPFDEVVDVPAEGWATDAPDADADGVEELVLLDWYVYDDVAHTLTPADVVYVIRSGEGLAYKLSFLSYYDNAGTPAVISFELDPMEEP
jgi:hypothetical protein